MLANYSLGNEVPGSNITFSLDGERGFLFERPAALTLMTGESSERDTQIGMCLVTGENAPIARLHSPIKGIGDKLAPLVSFNERAFESYGHSQGANAPVSEAAAFA